MPNQTSCCAGFAGGCHDKVANLIMAAPSVGWVDLSVINGEIVVKDGELKTLDLQVNTASSSQFAFLHCWFLGPGLTF